MSDQHLSVQARLVAADDAARLQRATVVDCRFALGDPDAGRAAYAAGHIPGAFYLDLERDLSAPQAQHGGRHPLPTPEDFAAALAALGIHKGSEVIAYDDSKQAFAARLWWMMRSLGYRPPRLLDGGYSAWLAAGGQPETALPIADPCEAPDVGHWTGVCDIDGLRQAQADGALVVDSREAARYEGREEPIDPVAGHIPGAVNRPWLNTVADGGGQKGEEGLREHWGDALAAEDLVVYCGSGVTACVNLFTLSRLGRNDATLYAGSWSDWCSYL
ncbi:sulfurtransferase [Parahaliea aestuarii]|uniref:Sulfurtransferase n=1 Tax=Parahaliea aestuarii TaxID=1852021 RepID=A0A5C9A733_9GAMM|nr:sulfurtransferase [Parahaliea aestuarii]TXS95021.1 sulfurtransferase [Parahaliea aestuarii]